MRPIRSFGAVRVPYAAVTVLGLGGRKALANSLVQEGWAERGPRRRGGTSSKAEHSTSRDVRPPADVVKNHRQQCPPLESNLLYSRPADVKLSRRAASAPCGGGSQEGLAADPRRNDEAIYVPPAAGAHSIGT